MNKTKIIISYEGESKFPEWATPEVLRAMHQQGRTLKDIGDQFGVSAEAIRQRILKAKGS